MPDLQYRQKLLRWPAETGDSEIQAPCGRGVITTDSLKSSPGVCRDQGAVRPNDPPRKGAWLLDDFALAERTQFVFRETRNTL